MIKFLTEKSGEDNNILETTEKKPLSKHAIAGFYFFRKGSDFVDSAMSMIKKDASFNDFYYISPAMNEMVLKNKRLKIHEIDNHRYHTFYTPQKIQEYERIKSC